MSAGWLVFDVPVVISRDEARERALAELAKAKYGGTPEWMHRASDAVVRIFDAIIELLRRITLVGRGSGTGQVSWGFVLVAVLLLAAVALVIWRVGLPRWRRRYGGATVDLDEARPAADYRRSAAAYAEAGDWAAAVRDRFRGLVRALEVRTVLDVRPARTAWEAAYSAAKELPECREDLRTAAESFNAVVYGDRPADAAAYAAMVTIDEHVMAVADRTPVGA